MGELALCRAAPSGLGLVLPLSPGRGLPWRVSGQHSTICPLGASTQPPGGPSTSRADLLLPRRPPSGSCFPLNSILEASPDWEQHSNCGPAAHPPASGRARQEPGTVSMAKAAQVGGSPPVSGVGGGGQGSTGGLQTQPRRLAQESGLARAYLRHRMAV